MAKIKLEDLEALASNLAELSNGWSSDSAKVSEKTDAFCAGYRGGFITGLAALSHAADVHAEGRELNEHASEHTYKSLRWFDLLAYLAGSKED